MHKILNQTLCILSIVTSFFLMTSCVTPKPGRIIDYHINPATKDKTCKVYVNIKYNENANGKFWVEGDIILTKKGNGQVNIHIPDESMHTKYMGGGYLPGNLTNRFGVSAQTAQEIAETIVNCHEFRHQYDHVQNPALALFGTGIDPKFDALRPKALISLERNSTGASCILLAKILKAGNGDLESGWKKMKNEKFDYDYFKKEIFEVSRQSDRIEGVNLYEQEACQFFKEYYRSSLINGTATTYSQALSLFDKNGYSSFDEFKTFFENIATKIFDECEKGTIKSERKESTKLFSQKIVSHTVELQKTQSQLSKIGSSFLKNLLNNNYHNTPQPSSTGSRNYCWSCRVKDPGMSRCVQPSCPNYGNPPSMAR